MNIASVASDTAWKDVKMNIEQTEMHVAEVSRLYPKTQVVLFPEISKDDITSFGKSLSLEVSFKEGYILI